MPSRRELDKELRKDVRWLGSLLGSVISELEGKKLFELEERIRKLAILRRRGPREMRGQAALALEQALTDLSPAEAEPVIRAFSHYFRLINLAEQHHRIRRGREHAAFSLGTPQRGSLAAILLAAKQAGVTAARAREVIASLEVTLTFTAHPSEATRRTLLEKLYHIASILERRDRCQLTDSEQQDAEQEIREEIATLWQTDEVRRERPTVGDEVKNVVWYIEEVLWDRLPLVTDQLSRAFERAYGEKLESSRLPVRIHSWVGGDMDGNPFVTPDVLEDAIRAYRARGLRQLLSAVRSLGRALSQSNRYAAVSPALIASIEIDAAQMPDVAREVEGRTKGEPWRRKLKFVDARLTAALESVEQERESARTGATASPAASNAYRDPAELEADLALIVESLAGAHATGQRRARSLLERVRALGFSIAELEMRTPAVDAREAAAHLRAASEGRAAGDPPAGARRLAASLEVVARAQKRSGETACRTLILSMAEGADDVLAALYCARQAGVWNASTECVGIDIVPLFETISALEKAPIIMRALFSDPAYRDHVARRGVQEVMLGYSDSGKEAGLLAASAALWRAQEALPAVGREAGVSLRMFHGRGETVARGGGPAQQAILALPRGSVRGRYKATEQGEALDQKYGRPELALRTLELTIGGALLHSLDAQETPPPELEHKYIERFEAMAAIGKRIYRGLVWENPRFAEFFFAATPYEEIAQLPIGSRPSKRHAGGLDALRAIPWVFAWTQTRVILPAWYGVGSALEEAGRRPEGADELAQMYRTWPFFRTVLDNVEMVLAKTDLGIGERYAKLANPESYKAIWTLIVEEHERTRRWLKSVTGSQSLLERNPTLKRSIQLRNPYVDPLNLIQVELVRRKRRGDAETARPLLLTLNGIAAGMRNTG